MNSLKDKPLTYAEKQKIYNFIYSKMNDDDRHPVDVIAEDFNGNEDAYLRRMAKWHDIPL